jgi:5'-3' exonuclease
MDCNSIIYDCYYELEEIYKKTPFDISTIEDQLIKKVIEKIEYYICLISPSKSAYITFDGVAPFAKMNQQRIRRYKTAFIARLSDFKKIWNTSAITPGTEFMKLLSIEINSHFQKKRNIKMMISCSDEPGEGEHKLFKYIRDNDCSDDNIAIYGLDSDLIMLSIFHRQFTKNIYVFREAPNFKTVLSSSFDKKENLFMDIDILCDGIRNEMNNGKANQTCIHDYVFMCFFLGNDFLPHFPSLNIRTNGFQILLDTYFKVIGKYDDRCFIHNGEIQWKWVKIFLNDIAKNERQYILNETISRDKMDNRSWSANTPEELEQLLTNAPIIYRQDEKYICPQEIGWEKRYYKALLNGEESGEVSVNYIEGLEWVYKYYTKDCVDWLWRYKYDYAPLMKDIVKRIGLVLLKKDVEERLSEKEQMMYVLPNENLYLLGEKGEEIKEKYKELYPKYYELKWGYCRYFWEAHPKLPEITIEMLKKM